MEWMTAEDHRKHHEELHAALDELVADYITHTKKFLSSSILNLMEWSYKQTIEPTDRKE